MSKALMFWSSGKDSAAALAAAAEDWEIEALVTTVNRPQHRVAVHHVPETLLDRQADRMGLPVEKIEIPVPCSNEEYEQRLLASLRPFSERGVETVIFGDINLPDIRAYREALLARAGMRTVFPLWERRTDELAAHQLASGIHAVVICVDTAMLSAEYVGREFNDEFVRSLPPGVDPCGENGEFHTFVSDAPVFAGPVPYSLADTRHDGRFSYAIITEPSQEPNHVER